jgi:hypothetical protein
MAAIDPAAAKKIADDFVARQKASPQFYQGGKFKEQLESISTDQSEPAGGGERQVESMEQIPTRVEVEKHPELKGFMEEVETGTDLVGGVTDDYTTRVLMGTNNKKTEKIVLPLSERQIQEGLHHKVWEGVRWLAEWCVRQIKMLHGKVIYKK